MQRSIDRRGVTGHAKPLIIAAAPMEFVKAGMAIEQRLLGYFACNNGGANEHQILQVRTQRSGSGDRTVMSYRRGVLPSVAKSQKILTHPFGVFSLAVRHRFFCTQAKEMGSRKVVPQRAQPFGFCLLFVRAKRRLPAGETCPSPKVSANSLQVLPSAANSFRICRI